MIKNFKWLLFASLSISIVACSDDESDTATEAPLTAGSADFSKYVALGDSFAAGYSDNGLFKKGQENSYPSILAEHFATVGGGTFNVPYMNDNLGGLLFGGNANPSFGKRIYLQGFLNATTPNIIPVPGNSSTEVFVRLNGPFNNLGVPGAKSFHLLAPGYGNPAGLGTAPATANPYFVRFASTPATSSVLSDALAQDPTFFSLWIGGNDVLGYATNGGVPTSQDPILGNDITPPATFEVVYKQLIAQLTTGGRKGVVANLPYINTLPFFTTVPYNPIPPLPASTATEIQNATLLNQVLGAINQIASAANLPPRFTRMSVANDDGAKPNNALLIKDESLPNLSQQITAALTSTLGAQGAAFAGNLYGQARHAQKTTQATDYILLTTRALIGTTQAGVPTTFSTIGVTYPLQDNRVLTATEVAEIKAATDAYNIVIKNAANENNLALVDTYAIMNQLLNGGVRFGNYQLTASFITGGAFSLDGVHPSARGYALIANKFLEAINLKYGSTIRSIDIGNYQIQYPVNLD